MSEIAVRVEGLGKQFVLRGKQEKYRTLRDTITHAAGAPVRLVRGLFSRNGSRPEPENTFWALKDISFEVKRGEVVGIIGRNGAGKSTLLKILSRITEPTEGYAEIYGRVGSLLEVGTGFHPELSGRENIFLNGAILGMRRREIERQFDEIVAFAEVEKFIDMPVKHYSSGMYLRLAFAVAAHLEPEILIVDEVLAVGDAAFQKKCMGKMQDVAGQGRTVLFVSHNMAAIQTLCSRGLLLESGHLLQDVPSHEAVQTYLRRGVTEKVAPSFDKREGDGSIRFMDVEIVSSEGETLTQLRSGQDIVIRMEYKADRDRCPSHVNASLWVNSLVGERFFVCCVDVVRDSFRNIPPEGILTCHVPRLPLPPGSYTLSVWCQANGRVADKVENALQFEVIPGNFYATGRLPNRKNSSVLIDYFWEITGRESSLPRRQ